MKNLQFSITPERVEKLEKHEIFVFGSNLLGNHAGGAALLAHQSFGAVIGVGEGLTGQSYALPTLCEKMGKRSIDELNFSIQQLLVTVNDNQDKKFIITEVGCGIAGFSYEEIAPLFKEFYPLSNVALPLNFVELLGIKGFKAFNKGFVCRDKTYAENGIFEEDVVPAACQKGMHFCPNPLDVLEYYSHHPENEYAEVVAVGNYEREENKVTTNKLKIKGRLKFGDLVKAHFEIVKETIIKAISDVKNSEETVTTAGQEAHANTAGQEAHANTAGNYAHANTAGNYAHANTAGQEAHANTAGNYAHANTAGNYAHANTAGQEAHANTAGNYAHANTAGQEAHANTAGQEAHANTAGNYAHANTAGNYAHANTAGQEAHANTAGQEAHANTAGYKAHANTAGNYAHANTAGQEAHANTAGNYAHANTAGEESIASSLGVNSSAKASKGWIVLVDWRYDDKWFINDIFRAKVGKHKIKGVLIQPDVKYWFENGELKSE